MTRISSYSLYECPRCQQIHIKPVYGSISAYIPLDISFKPTDIKACRGCREEIHFEDFKYLGMRSKVNTKQPTRLELLFRKLLNKPYLERDVRKLYPKFN